MLIPGQKGLIQHHILPTTTIMNVYRPVQRISIYINNSPYQVIWGVAGHIECKSCRNRSKMLIVYRNNLPNNLQATHFGLCTRVCLVPPTSYYFGPSTFNIMFCLMCWCQCIFNYLTRCYYGAPFANVTTLDSIFKCMWFQWKQWELLIKSLGKTGQNTSTKINLWKHITVNTIIVGTGA